ncbi:MAG TPA: helix-turn-helix domain-containing protein [Solirubrobacteraceae bacterium]|nr:helix-turn-helix domain-containing protein [Solirubrobacteraceae bacterium]
MAATRPIRDPDSYRVGDDGVAAWSERHAEAWIGLLETHKQLTRVLDAELESRYGLSLSGLELLARLAAAPERCLRLSALAAQAGLSLSRVSRIAVMLETRGLIERVPCHEDARAVEAHLTPEGLALMREAQRTHFASIQERFFDQLRPGELEVLADVFGRFSERAVASCTEPPHAAESSG